MTTDTVAFPVSFTPIAVAVEDEDAPIAAVVLSVIDTWMYLEDPRIERDAPPVGAHVHLSWVVNGGVCECGGTIVSTEHGEERSWIISVETAPVRLQRRHYVRVPMSGSAEIIVRGKRHIDAELADISEGGVRCTVPSRTLISLGESVEVRFGLDSGPLKISCLIMRLAAGRSDEELDLGLQFISPSSYDADRIRKQVFTEQVRQRRSQS
jgi:hypothetical protein